MTAEDAVLRLDRLSRSFGSLVALDAVSLDVRRGTRHALIGPNGAGKSTLFDLAAGTQSPTAGRIVFDGVDLTRMPEHRRAGRGIARTFQHASVFLRCTALENVLCALQRRTGHGWSMLSVPSRRRDLVARAIAALDRLDLGDVRNHLAGELSHGERRQLELAMALVVDPVLLLLDEPAAGMSAAETARLATVITALPTETTILLIEHDLDLVFDVADTVTVLHLGRHLRTGDPATVRCAEDVKAAYLGSDDVRLFSPGTVGTG